MCPFDDTRENAMATVIPFPIDCARKRLPGAGEPKGEVVIFTGVRYERLDFSLADRLPPRNGRPTAQARLLDYDNY